MQSNRASSNGGIIRVSFFEQIDTAQLLFKGDHIMEKKKLTKGNYLFIGSMLFGMFFGAGNLIFPIHLGQLAGSHCYQLPLGF